MEDPVRGLGRAMFAGVLLMVGGALSIIWGIAALGNSHFFAGNQHYVFANLHTWGWVTLILGVLELLAAVSLFAGGVYGRFFAIVVASLTAIGALLDLPAYPFWSIAVFALSLYIIHGLFMYHGVEAYDASASAVPMSTAVGDGDGDGAAARVAPRSPSTSARA